MSALVADTQAVVWYLIEPHLLTAAAISAMDAATAAGEPIWVASITLVELCYLVEKKKLPAEALEWLRAELDNPTSAFALVALGRKVADAVSVIARDVVPDMPDRVIAATAHQMGLPLVTSDRRIRASGISVIW